MNKEAKEEIPVGPSAIKQLSNKGKKALFEAIEEYTDATAKYHLYKAIVKYHDGKKERKLARDSVEELDLAKKALKEMIDALEIRLV